MTVYIDDANIDGQWCHLMSDNHDDAEIHAFAQRLGLKRAWFHGDHYDVCGNKKARALALGAVPCHTTMMVSIRRAKRRALSNRGYLVPPPTMAEVQDFINQWKLKEI